MQVPSARADVVLDLFDKYYERVYLFLRKSSDPEVAEDLAQEVFVRLLQHPQLERLTISVSYLIKIGHNLLRRRYARAARLRELLQERATAGEPVVVEGPGLALDSTVLEAAMGLLTSDEQSAVRLIVCEGRSYEHAAESLGVSVTTINNWKHRGLSKLRKCLQESAREQELAEVEPIANAGRSANRRADHQFVGRVDALQPVSHGRADDRDHVPVPASAPIRGGRRPAAAENAGLRWRRSCQWAAATDSVA
ncbi:MAG: RNA polymerase sigma factor [Phycisphaerae bacterium]|nr:RNA polymerase sigma factor [Phycisphaerae bacterium]